MSMYVFAPAGPRELRNNLLRVAIEYIGSKQKGIGSPWAKGKRYLRNQLSCRRDSKSWNKKATRAK